MVTPEELEAIYSRHTCPVCLKNKTTLYHNSPWHWFGSYTRMIIYVCLNCGLTHLHTILPE
jgi:C4-type Zn-finger protein